MSGSGELDPQAEVRADDPGAHQLAEHSDSEDQFTDAHSAPMSPQEGSPISKTRVEKVDNEPAHGEVPGTSAYNPREEDAEPDEISVEKEREESNSPSPTISDLPTTVVEEAPEQPASPKPDTMHQADAAPDVVLSPDDDDAGDKNSVSLAAPEPTGRQRRRSSRASRSPILDQEGDGGDDVFGDDFDDFEDGAEDEDFDDFEDGFQQPQVADQSFAAVQQPVLPYPVPDLDGLDSEDLEAATGPYLNNLFPPGELDVPELPPLPKEASAFTTPRSASLWSQLVAPPPLAPPDWIRSRTRRLFLVSLGVPVDLDEILPASKQKKLVLPSLNLPSSTSPRGSSDSRPASRLRLGEGNASSTSVDTQGKPKKRKGPPAPPEFDMVAARLACTTTDEALDGMTNAELKDHVSRLEALQGSAKEVLEFWQKRTDEKIAERDTFEGVIENLVKHARKVRK